MTDDRIGSASFRFLLGFVVYHHFRAVIVIALAACLLAKGVFAAEPFTMRIEDAPESSELVDDSWSGGWQMDLRNRIPAMIGDFYGGSPLGFRADSSLDSLFVLGNDLDAPLALPPNGSLLTITEPGPVGIFSSTVQSTQQLQALLRANSPAPVPTLVNTINDNATMTTSQTIGQIQTFLASTPLAYDIITLQSPPASYQNGVDAAFSARNSIPGITTYNSAASGAFLQGGADSLAGGSDLDAFYFYDYVVRFNTALADATSGGVGRMKIAEGGTVLTQDRVYFRYSYFDTVRYSNSGVGLNRYTPGFEKTFLDRMMSVELRAPFVTNTTTSSVLNGGGFSNGDDTRFGNLSVYLKTMLINRDQLAISGGLGVVLPTASDIRVAYADGTPLLNVANDSARLQPFLGALYTPNDRWFAQGFLQYDVATAGNRVALNSTGSGLAQAGKLTDASNLFVDLGIGYWAYRNDTSQGLTGIVPSFEIHQNTAINSGDITSAGPFQVGNFSGTPSQTNFVAGTTFEFAQSAHLTVAYTGPLSGGANRQYNSGLQVFYSCLLGR